MSLNTVQKRIVVQAKNALQEIKTHTSSSNALQKEQQSHNKWKATKHMQAKNAILTSQYNRSAAGALLANSSINIRWLTITFR